MVEKRGAPSQSSSVTKPIDCKLKRWGHLTVLLGGDRICRTNNTAERALPRKSWLFCGCDRGGQRAAAMYSLTVTAKMNGIDPRMGPPTCLSRRRACGAQPRRAAAAELDTHGIGFLRSRVIAMHVNAVSRTTTIDSVAKDLRESEDRLSFWP